MGDMPGMPTRRAVEWAMVGRPVHEWVWRRLVDVAGLDGYAAAAAIADALRCDSSPWAPLVDELRAAAYRELVLEPVRAFVQVVTDAFAPVARAASEAVLQIAESLRAHGFDLAVPAEPTEACRCLCPMHRAAQGVCVGEAPAGELVDYQFPNMARHTVRMCRPCAAAQDARFSRPAVTAG